MKRSNGYIHTILPIVMLFTLTPAMGASRGVTGAPAVDSLSTGVATERFHLSMRLQLDSLQVPSNRRVIYTPLLVGEATGDTAVFTPLMVNGRRQHLAFERDSKGFRGMEVRRDGEKSQSISYTASVPYAPWMDNSTLYLTDDICGCGRVIDRNRSELAVFHPEPEPEYPVLSCWLTPEVEAVKTRAEKGRAYIDFPVNRTELYPDYRRNTDELAKILATINLVRDNSDLEMTRVGIHGYASPEGPWSNNVRLASGRARTLTDYVRVLGNLQDVPMTVESTPEDWEGLRAYVDSTSLSGRQGILALIDSDLAPDAKDARIKKDFPTDYAFLLREVYPALRHSDYEVEYTVRPFNLEEARVMIRKDPRKLSLHEMYMVAQSYPAGSDDFNEVFGIAVRIFPDDPVANLNAAIAAVNRRDTKAARYYVAKATDSPQKTEVLEAIATLEGMID